MYDNRLIQHAKLCRSLKLKRDARVKSNSALQQREIDGKNVARHVKIENRRQLDEKCRLRLESCGSIDGKDSASALASRPT